MSFLDYLLIAVALAGYAGIGWLFARGHDPVRNMVTGLLVVAGVAASLAWTAPLYIVPLFRAAIGVGLMAVVYKTVQFRGKRINTSAILGVAIAMVIAGAWYYDWHYRFYHTTEQELYFAPFVEMFLADYAGPLRATTFYPAPLTSMHIAPSAIWAAMCALIPHPTMIHGIEARWLLGAGIIGHVFWLLYRHSGRPAWIFVPVALAVLYVMDWEIRWSFSTSSQTFYLILLEIVGLALTVAPSDEEDGRAREAVILGLGLIMLKTSVIYVPLALAGYYVLRFRSTRFHWSVITMGAIVAAQLLTTLSRPRPYPDIRIGFSLANPFSSRPVMDYRFDIPLGGDFSDVSLAWWSIAAAGILYMIKYTLLPMAALRHAESGDKLRGGLIRGLQVMVLSILVAWVMIRNSQQGTLHVLWTVVFVTAPLAAAWACAAVSKGGWKWMTGLAATVAIMAGFGHVPWTGTPDFGGISYNDLRTIPAEQLLVRRGDEPINNVGLRALMLGQRLPASGPLGQSGVLASFIHVEGLK